MSGEGLISLTLTPVPHSARDEGTYLFSPPFMRSADAPVLLRAGRQSLNIRRLQSISADTP